MTDTARPEQRSRKQNRAASKGAKGSQQGRGNDASKNKQEGWMPGRQIPTLACPHLYTEHDVYGMEYSLWPVWVNYSVCLSPSFLHLQISETWKAGQCPWSHSQQLVSSGCLSTFFTHEIQNTPATERKINSIPAKTRTEMDFRQEREFFAPQVRCQMNPLLISTHCCIPYLKHL